MENEIITQSFGYAWGLIVLAAIIIIVVSRR